MANVEVTGAARLYRAASGGPQGYAFDSSEAILSKLFVTGSALLIESGLSTNFQTERIVPRTSARRAVADRVTTDDGNFSELKMMYAVMPMNNGNSRTAI